MANGWWCDDCECRHRDDQMCTGKELDTLRARVAELEGALQSIAAEEHRIGVHGSAAIVGLAVRARKALANGVCGRAKTPADRAPGMTCTRSAGHTGPCAMALAKGGERKPCVYCKGVGFYRDDLSGGESYCTCAAGLALAKGGG